MLSILYEDDAIIFLDKPAGVVVQRGYDQEEPVLFEELSRHLGERGERPWLLQRLDRGTTGVIFFTKRAELNARVTRQFEKRIVKKHYLALAAGRLRCRQRIDAPLARIGPISFGVREGGKNAVTLAEPIAFSERASLLKVRLLTGRTHQIRVHLSACGHPLAGDWLYGSRDASRPMLHAWRVEMLHPVTGMAIVVEARPAADLIAEAAARGVEVPIDLVGGRSDRDEGRFSSLTRL